MRPLLLALTLSVLGVVPAYAATGMTRACRSIIDNATHIKNSTYYQVQGNQLRICGMTGTVDQPGKTFTHLYQLNTRYGSRSHSWFYTLDGDQLLMHNEYQGVTISQPQVISVFR